MRMNSVEKGLLICDVILEGLTADCANHADCFLAQSYEGREDTKGLKTRCDLGWACESFFG